MRRTMRTDHDPSPARHGMAPLRNPSPARAARVLVLAWAALAAPGCGRSDDVPPADAPVRDAVGPLDPSGWDVSVAGWASVTAADTGTVLRACALGDVDADRPGHEIVAVGDDGRVHLVAFAHGAWTARVLARLPGALASVALGDIDPARPGLEIVVAGVTEGALDDGGEGAAHVLFREGAAWETRPIVRTSAALHAAFVGELASERPGVEVLVAGDDRLATVLGLGASGFEKLVSSPLPGPGRAAAAHPGGVVVACADGTLAMLRREQERHWSTEHLAPRAAGAFAVASDDERLLAARDDGTLELVQGLVGKPVHTESEPLRGAVFGNVDVVSPGLEIAAAGRAGRVTVHRHRGGSRWTGELVFDDGAPLACLTAGVLPSVGAGVFLVTCGDSGRVTVIAQVPPAPNPEPEDGAGG